jgi:hypothetical protein
VSKSIMTGPSPSSASNQCMLAFATTFDLPNVRVSTTIELGLLDVV